MIDFNAIMNAIFEQALKPLNDKIEAQNKRIADLEEFIARWNFGNKEKFDEAVKDVAKDVAKDVCTQYIDALEERVVDQIDNIDVEDTVETILNNKDWERELRGVVEDEVERQMENIDLEDKVRDILKNATVTTEISV